MLKPMVWGLIRMALKLILNCSKVKDIQLVFLKNPNEIKLFEINKSGFGAMVSWITVDNLSKVRL